MGEKQVGSCPPEPSVVWVAAAEVIYDWRVRITGRVSLLPA